MSIDQANDLTTLANYFLVPRTATHRQYEALRAYFVEGLPSAEVAQRFGYTPGSFRVLCHQFRQQPERPFFLPPRQAPSAAPRNPLRERVIGRDRNAARATLGEGLSVSAFPLDVPV